MNSSQTPRRTSERLRSKATSISLTPFLEITPLKRSSTLSSTPSSASLKTSKSSKSTTSASSSSKKVTQKKKPLQKQKQHGRPKKLFSNSSTPVIITPEDSVKPETLDLWASLQSSNLSVKVLVYDWIKLCKGDPSAALLTLINTVIQAAGCSKLLNPSQFEDQDAVTDYLEELQLYPIDSPQYLLVNKSSAVKATRRHFFLFFTILLDSHQDIIFDDEILEIICSWIVAMSSSKSRPFRHTATSLALHLCTCLCGMAIQTHSYAAVAKEALFNLFNSVFVHRYRDVYAFIRRECLLSLTQWLEIAPDLFLDAVYLRYFGWLLNDHETSVRLTSLNCLIQIYKHPTLQQGMQLFSERFKSRLIEMALYEIDKPIQLAAAHVISLMYPLGYIEHTEVFEMSKLAFQLTSPHLLSIFEKEFLDYDWNVFAEFFVDLLNSVYGKENHQIETAIHFFMKNYPLPLHQNLTSLIKLLKTTDQDVPNDKVLCQCLNALVQLHPDKMQPFLSDLRILLEKYKSEFDALTCFVHIIKACKSIWPTSTAFTNVLLQCLDFFNEQFLQSVDAEFLKAVSLLYSECYAEPNLETLIAPKLTYLKEHTHLNHPQGLLALLKRFPIPLDPNSLDETEVHMQLHFLYCLWNKKTDPFFLTKAMNVLENSLDAVWMANLLMEYHVAFQLAVSDLASVQIERCFSLHPEGCIDQFSKLFVLRLIDKVYLASIFPLYRKSSDYIDSVIENGLIPLLALEANNFVHQVCLTSIQKLSTVEEVTILASLFFKLYKKQSWSTYPLFQRIIQWSLQQKDTVLLSGLKDGLLYLSLEEAKSLLHLIEQNPLFSSFEPLLHKRIQSFSRKSKKGVTHEPKLMATSELTQEPFAKDLSFIHEESEEEIEETMEDVTEEKEDKVSVLTSSTIQRMESLKKEINDSTQSDIFFQSPIKTLSSMNESSEERSPDDPSMEIDFAGSPPIKRRRRY